MVVDIGSFFVESWVFGYLDVWVKLRWLPRFSRVFLGPLGFRGEGRGGCGLWDGCSAFEGGVGFVDLEGQGFSSFCGSWDVLCELRGDGFL